MFLNVACGYSALIANFEFEPSFVGQTIKPAAAITMSTFRDVLAIVAYTFSLKEPTDGMPLRVRRAL